MKKFKKQFLAATLVVALAAAVYLNWSLTAPKAVSKTLGETKLVNATVATVKTTEPTTAKKQSAKPNSSLSAKQQSFFAEAKTSRDKAQDKVIDKSSEILGSEKTAQNEKNEAQLQISGMLKNFTLQDTIESTLKAKGFSAALCYINDNGCTVTVLKNELKKGREILVKSTVQSATNIGFDKITIVTV